MPAAVTIAVPVLDGEEFLAETLASAVEQRRDVSYVDILVVDNASTDGTRALAEAHADAGLIRYVRFERQVPMAENWNRCLELATGDFVVLLHADDVLETGMVARARALLERHPEAGFCFGACRFIDEQGRVTGAERRSARDAVLPPRDIFRRHARGNFVYCPTVMIRRAALPAGAGFRADLTQLLDWDMWLRMELDGWAVGYVSKFQARYRRYPRARSGANVRRGGHLGEELGVLERLAARPSLPRWGSRGLATSLARAAGRLAFLGLVGTLPPDVRGGEVARVARAVVGARSRRSGVSLGGLLGFADAALAFGAARLRRPAAERAAHARR